MIRVEMDIACPFGSYRPVRYTRSSKRDPHNDPYARGKRPLKTA
jgi:hypothetical protein